MNILYQNVNRIRSKLNELYLTILNCNYDIICLTETNFNVSVSDCEIFDYRYNVFRRDRCSSSNRKKEGGGVVIAIKRSYDVIRQSTWESDLEDIWITIKPTSKIHPKLNICLSYIPSYTPTESLTYFFKKCNSIVLNAGDGQEFLCIGDYNLPNIQWTPHLNSSYFIPSAVSDNKSNLLLETMTLCGFFQFNGVGNKNNRQLDLVLCTLDDLSVLECVPLSNLDQHHPALEIKLRLGMFKSSPKTLKTNKCLNYFKSNFDRIRSDLLKVSWETLLSSANVNDNSSVFYETLNGIISKHTPRTSVTSNKYPHWFSLSLRKCLVEKQKYHKLFRKYQNPRDYDGFSLLRARCKRLINQCYRKYVASVEDGLATNIKYFWTYVNGKRNKCDTIPRVMNYAGMQASDYRGVCELFSKYFSSVYEEVSSAPIPPTSTTSNSCLSTITISVNEVEKKLKTLDLNKCAGPDCIPPLVGRQCAAELSAPLCILFNQSISSGLFPDIWKVAHVIPIHKDNDKSQCENYRPISILSCFPKIFEALVYEVIYSHVNSLISTRQHGFVRKKSTVSNLLEYKHYLCGAFAKNIQVDSIYTDFSKAFDKVNHAILCSKLQSMGIHGSLLRWVESYLFNRSQLVAVKGEVSEPATVTSGVPQGSHLGPLLFNIFVNDLVSQLKCPSLLYADDLKIYSTITNLGDALSLQSDLETISQWCCNNLMFLNVKKCFMVTFTKKINKICFTYKLNNQIIMRRSLAKDLGVIFDEKLTFKDHYDFICSKASRLLGFVLRVTKHFKNSKSLIYLFNSLVRSTLEYGAIVWSPFYATHIKHIESVQRKFLRVLSFRQGYHRRLSSYKLRLDHFKMISLEGRRKLSELIFLHKIVNSLIDSPSILSSINFNIVLRSRRSRLPDLFSLQVFRNNISYFNPIVRMCRLYNDTVLAQPEIDIFTPNPNVFRRSIATIV
jgi:hypothetical protein